MLSWRRLCTKGQASRAVIARGAWSVRGGGAGPIARPRAISTLSPASSTRLDKTSRREKTAEAGELVLRRHEEARFSLIPPLRTTLGLNGPRPLVGPLDGPELVSVVGALTRVRSQVTTRLTARWRGQATRQTTASGRRGVQAALARHLREIGRTSPAARSAPSVLVLDQAPWPRGSLLAKALQAWPPRELCRWPRDRPPLPAIARFWKVWRRRATPNRLFDTIPGLKRALRNRLGDDQTLRHRVLSVRQAPHQQTTSSAA